ncbi:MAG: hypothetical protein HFI64_04300 [Lachnospiraceae bacterium]|nr:hypothetical protein [Lachnospiraceae bacterium]
MQEIIIGKHTLESLTTGMYADPFVIYREYIQNAADSIDAAFESGVLCRGEECVDVIIHSAEKRIIIKDNGLGVYSDEAVSHLLSIGNSKKKSTATRGFRGIGRLSGLSYCSTLTFETSARGDTAGTRITIDANKLSEILANVQNDTETILDVLSEVYSIETYPERENVHYFSVTMDGVDESVKLTDYDEVIAYLSQNVPVPYHPEKFTWGREITNRLAQKGCVIESYKVFVTCQNKREPVYKPYGDSFLMDKGKKTTDRISDVQIISFVNSDKELLAAGWVAKTSFLGSIYDRTIKGIRVRKGNILIGDGQTLNVAFKDARFNGWSIGEIFAMHPKLVPNARRDNFEKNPTYFTFIEKLTTLAGGVTREIRNVSLKRNAELSAALEATARVSEAAAAVMSEGVSLSQKSALKNKLTKAQNAVGQVPVNGESDAYYQGIAFEGLDILIGQVKGATSYKALNLLDNISLHEKRWLEQIFNIIIRIEPGNSEKIITAVLDELYGESKKKGMETEP